MTPFFDTRQEYPMMHTWCNLVIPGISYFHGQAEFSRILSQNDQHDLENQGQWPLFSIPAKIIPGSMFGANLVILAQICEDLLSGQIKFPKILCQNSQNDLEGQGQWPSFSIPDKSIWICMFGANLVIPSQICDELLCGQAKFPRILSQNCQNDLEGQGQWPLFSIPAESIPGCIFVANLMILLQICDELSCRQSKVHGRMDRWTDRRTDAGNDNTPSAWKAKG